MISGRTVIALSIAMIVVAACAPNQPAPAAAQPAATATSAPAVAASSIGDVVGTWRAPRGGGVAILEFKTDGTFTVTDTQGKEYDSGKFWFEGTTLIFESASDGICHGGIGSHELDVTKRDDKPVRLDLRVIDDPCEFRMEAITNGVLYFVEP